MRSRKQVMVLVLAIVLVASVAAFFGCAAAPAPAPKAPAAPGAPAAPQTLKIGVNMGLNWPLGLDAQKAILWDTETTNAAGGFDIGGQKYKIEYDWADNKMDETTSKPGTERLVSQDGCKFVVGDVWIESGYPIAEKNQIILIGAPSDNSLYDPSYNWCFHGGIAQTTFFFTIPYAVSKNPSLKTYLGVYADNANGRGSAATLKTVCKNSGLTTKDDLYYSLSSTDLSAIGAKIKQENPDILGVIGGGPPHDSMVLKAAFVAGWKGTIVSTNTAPGQVLVGIAGADAVEGLIGEAWPAELEPVTNPIAKQWKADYTAKYGKWDDPETINATSWWVLKGALQKAGSTDVNKVKAALEAGSPSFGIMGTGVQVPRPDFGCNKARQLVIGDIVMKQIKGGQTTALEKLDWAKSMNLLKMEYGFTVPPPQ